MWQSGKTYDYKTSLKALMQTLAEEYESGVPVEESVKRHNDEYHEINMKFDPDFDYKVVNEKLIKHAVSLYGSESFKENVKETIVKLTEEKILPQEIAKRARCSVTYVYRIQKDMGINKNATIPKPEFTGITPEDIEWAKEYIKPGMVLRMRVLVTRYTVNGGPMKVWQVEDVRIEGCYTHFVNTNFGCLKWSDIVVGLSKKG